MRVSLPKLQKAGGPGAVVYEGGDWRLPPEEWLPALTAVLQAATVAEQRRALTFALLAATLDPAWPAEGRISSVEKQPLAKTVLHYGPASRSKDALAPTFLRVNVRPVPADGLPAEITRITNWHKDFIDACYAAAPPFAAISSIASKAPMAQRFPDGSEAVAGPANDLGRVVVAVLAAQLDTLYPDMQLRTQLDMEPAAGSTVLF